MKELSFYFHNTFVSPSQHNLSEFENKQVVKLQEAPEAVPGPGPLGRQLPIEAHDLNLGASKMVPRKKRGVWGE